jgi:DNA repair protein RadA/Sms
VYVSVAGGVRILEPAVDLPLALALASALKDIPVPLAVASFGELGLTGQVRPVSLAGTRVKEAVRFGLTRVLAHAPASLDPADVASLTRVETLGDALRVLG